MSPSFRAVADEALKLSPEDREALVETLIVSLERPDTLHPEWEAEIARRLEAVQAGRARLIPADEALAQLAAHVHARRPRGA
jgi:putative addiction module component (TIGR02574 family)